MTNRGVGLAILTVGWLNGWSALAEEIKNPHEWGITASESRAADRNADTQQQASPANSAGQMGRVRINAAVSPPSGDRVPGEGYCNPSEKPQDAQCRDLLAQEKMARWAVIAVILTAVGVALIWRTLHHTRRAVDFTKGMLSEAQASTAAAVLVAKIAGASERPWVICSDIKLKKPTTYTGDRYKIDAIVSVTNTGPVLAKAVRIKIDITTMLVAKFVPFYKTHPAISKAYFSLHQPDWPMGTPIAPNQTAKFHHGWGGPQAGNSISPTKKEVHSGAFFLVGYIRYYNPHGEEHCTRFVFHPDADSVNPWDQITLRPAGGYGEAT